MTRRLFIIPIVHAEADLGGLADALRETSGDRAWQDKRAAVDAAWERIAEWAAGFDAAGARIYQDGLPADDAAPRIVADLASRGSRNHQIVAGLMARGASLVGTEDPALLLREYEIAKAAADAIAAGREPDLGDAGRPEALLARRDRFIADRILATLPPGQRGVLFIGLLHEVERVLNKDIEAVYPLGRPRIVRGGPGGSTRTGGAERASDEGSAA